MKRKAFMIILVIVAIIAFYFLKTENSQERLIPSTNQNNTSTVVIGKDCPEEMNKEYLYLIHNPYTGEFPVDTRIYANATFNNRGTINSYCRKASKTGENVNYLYCDSNNYGVYTRNRAADENGVLQNIEEWKIGIIGDIQSCENQGEQEVSNMVSLPIYKCKIVKADCSKK